MNERAERINGWAAMIGGIHDGSYKPQVKLFQESGERQHSCTSLIGGFIFATLLSEDVSDDDDNGPDSGLMQPVYQGSQ